MFKFDGKLETTIWKEGKPLNITTIEDFQKNLPYNTKIEIAYVLSHLSIAKKKYSNNKDIYPKLNIIQIRIIS